MLWLLQWMTFKWRLLFNITDVSKVSLHIADLKPGHFNSIHGHCWGRPLWGQALRVESLYSVHGLHKTPRNSPARVESSLNSASFSDHGYLWRFAVMAGIVNSSIRRMGLGCFLVSSIAVTITTRVPFGEQQRQQEPHGNQNLDRKTFFPLVRTYYLCTFSWLSLQRHELLLQHTHLLFSPSHLLFPHQTLFSALTILFYQLHPLLSSELLLALQVAA